MDQYEDGRTDEECESIDGDDERRAVAHVGEVKQRELRPARRGAGSAMMKAASAGETMPDSDQVVCIMPLALGSRPSGTSIAYDASKAA